MEYLLVKFPEYRGVTVDGMEQGKTNVLLELGAGSYTISLNPSDDLKPHSKKVKLQKTSPLKPLKLTFEKKKK